MAACFWILGILPTPGAGRSPSCRPMVALVGVVDGGPARGAVVSTRSHSVGVFDSYRRGRGTSRFVHQTEPLAQRGTSVRLEEGPDPLPPPVGPPEETPLVLRQHLLPVLRVDDGIGQLETVPTAGGGPVHSLQVDDHARPVAPDVGVVAERLRVVVVVRGRAVARR
eukprot:CAMPEP_0194315108 /NCGR_PEP_ID=MMETSP0171-20130528/11922_1 /TAXON_ID=218684 /ORGANISM="Corethron pennatum, Strain L29A3" /LENGTH=166 /DNA_ID=CAMNT_0039070789 /DNA_START=353 /DNA_END=850 /DNA_ORIENTATION=+